MLNPLPFWYISKVFFVTHKLMESIGSISFKTYLTFSESFYLRLTYTNHGRLHGFGNFLTSFNRLSIDRLDKCLHKNRFWIWRHLFHKHFLDSRHLYKIFHEPITRPSVSANSELPLPNTEGAKRRITQCATLGPNPTSFWMTVWGKNVDLCCNNLSTN